MRQPAFTPVEQVPLVGGRLCLDFVNTTGARSGSRPRERLFGKRRPSRVGRRFGSRRRRD